jgi:hypothetical protein
MNATTKAAEFESITDSMEDCIVMGAYRRNSDGTVTVNCQIDLIDHATGEAWGVCSRVIRLPRLPDRKRRQA